MQFGGQLLIRFDIRISFLISQKETVLVLEENQSLENALRTLLQELVVRFLMWLHESLFSPNDKIVRDCYRHLHFSGPLHH